MDKTETYLVQYRLNAHEDWKDDTKRSSTPLPSKDRRNCCADAKIFRGAEFRIIKRTDEEYDVGP